MVARKGSEDEEERDEEIWPEWWGITLSQCQALMRECKQDPAWRSTNRVYTLVQDFVKPRTAGTGMGYALLTNREKPLEVGVMVSHTWAENAEEFFETLERTVSPDEVMFICALSVYQSEDGAGPSIVEQLGSMASESPFRRVLDHILKRGQAQGWRWRWRSQLKLLPGFCFTVALFLYYFVMGRAGCIPLPDGRCAVGRISSDGGAASPGSHHRSAAAQLCMLPMWTFDYVRLGPAFAPLLFASVVMLLLAVLLCLSESRWLGRFRGRMVAVPNGQCDLYSRLWCVYEIFVATKLRIPVEMARTLAPAGQCSASNAVCGCERDMERICNEIEAWGQSLTRSSMLGGASTLSIATRKMSDQRTSTERAYATVDRAINLLMRRAQREVLLALLAWVVPLSVLALAVPRGDFSSTDQFFGTVVCTGVQSVVIVGVVVVLVLYRVAKASHGSLGFTSTLFVAGGFVFAGAALRTVDHLIAGKDPSGLTNFPPLHHCFTLHLASAGLSLALLVLGARAFGSGFARWRFRSHLMTLLAASALGTVLLLQAQKKAYTAEQLLPMSIWYISFRILPVLGYPAFLWLAAGRWGVGVGPKVKAKSAKCDKQAHTDIESMTG